MSLQSEVPVWLAVALEEIGEREVPGGQSNLKILKYHSFTKLKASSDEVPWCSAFVNYCMEKAGIKGTNDATAKSWLKWGKRSYPALGCICVIKRGDQAWQGHVGFFIKQNDNYVWLLGGNQGNEVSIAKYPRDLVLDFRTDG